MTRHQQHQRARRFDHQLRLQGQAGSSCGNLADGAQNRVRAAAVIVGRRRVNTRRVRERVQRAIHMGLDKNAIDENRRSREKRGQPPGAKRRRPAKGVPGGRDAKGEWRSHAKTLGRWNVIV